MRLHVQSDGVVKGGHVDYELNEDHANYSGEVVLKMGWMKKKHRFGGITAINNQMVASSTYRKPVGTENTLGDVKYRILRRDNLETQLHLQHTAEDVSGTADLDTTSDVIKVEELKIHVNLLGYRLVLTLHA